MTNQPVDPQELAALLEGRLSRADAARVREQLANSDDDTVAAFADAVAIESEIGDRLGTRRDRWKTWRRVAYGSSALIAAALVAAVVLRRPSSQNDTGTDTRRFALALPNDARVPGEHAWSTVRGDATGMSIVSRSVRMGSLMTDLELSRARSDSAQLRVAAELAATLEGTPGADAVVDQLRQAAASPSVQDTSLMSLGSLAVQFADSVLVGAGAWLEAARVASSAGHAAFFAQHPASITIGPAVSHPTLRPVQVAALQTAMRVGAATPLDLRALNAAVVAALRVLAE